MDKLNDKISGQEPQIEDITSVKHIDEAEVSEVVEAAAKKSVVVKPKFGLGLAALFKHKKHDELQDTEESIHEPEPASEADAELGEPVPAHRNGKLKSVLECLLFVSDGPLTSKQLAELLELHVSHIENGLDELEACLEDRGGLQLMRVAGGYQLCTKIEYSDYCSLLLQPSKKKLSKAALETLAVVAYRQPCTMPEIEAVRGVAVDGVMKTLCERGLVKEAGRRQTPGRPILYATTPEFLEHFGLNDLSELPDIDMLAVEEVKALEAQRELFLGEQSDPEESEETQES